MSFVTLASPEGKATLEAFRLRDPGEHKFVYRNGHSSLCRCCMRQPSRRPNKFIPCDCWWGSGGPIGQPPAPSVPRPSAQHVASRAVAELVRIEFGIDFECPSCGRGEQRGHAPGCELKAFLMDAAIMSTGEEAPRG